MKLTKRLQVLLDILPPVKNVADIGCDHGKLSLALLERGSCVWGVDISAPSLHKARTLIAGTPYAHRFTPVEGDGLVALEGVSLDGAVIAGLSGFTIGDMLRSYNGGPIVLALQVPKGEAALRETLDALGYPVLAEFCTYEAGHTYFSILARAERTERDPVWPEPEYSNALLEAGDSTYLRWLRLRRQSDMRTMEKLEAANTAISRMALEALRARREKEDGMLAVMEAMHED